MLLGHTHNLLTFIWQLLFDLDAILEIALVDQTTVPRGGPLGVTSAPLDLELVPLQ